MEEDLSSQMILYQSKKNVFLFLFCSVLFWFGLVWFGLVFGFGFGFGFVFFFFSNLVLHTRIIFRVSKDAGA